ncbi:hypothetical protein CUN85_07445 [Methanolobus halotolerans]|uniref:Uncharacterized protein n=1 Tax=Methanolobus halotolerans TaxID=2052935 RepID=A0A4E0Q5Q3_9EURY|nr:hypothetical protein CUN85_07445 [Methanolobus halotolerans]
MYGRAFSKSGSEQDHVETWKFRTERLGHNRRLVELSEYKTYQDCRDQKNTRHGPWNVDAYI